MLPTIFTGQGASYSEAILALSDGTVFNGVSIGADGSCVAELVFNTALSGHQELITDPSYAEQIVVFTYPHIGSTGVNSHDSESNGTQINGLVIRDCPPITSNFRSEQSLPDYLRANGIVAISGVDTRMLVRILRDKGKQSACIMVGGNSEEAIAMARAHEGKLHNPTPSYTETTVFEPTSTTDEKTKHIVAIDFGIKNSAISYLTSRGCKVTVLPNSSDIAQITKLAPDALYISGGAGQANSNSAGLDTLQQLLETNIPLFAVGYGAQLLAVALGASVSPLEVGNHGINHPVQNVETGRVYISCQKQDFQINKGSLPKNLKPEFVSLFDGSLQGFSVIGKPIMATQFYPEGAPGPSDLTHIIDQFFDLTASNS